MLRGRIGEGKVARRHFLLEGARSHVHLSTIDSEFKEFSSEHERKEEKTPFYEKFKGWAEI